MGIVARITSRSRATGGDGTPVIPPAATQPAPTRSVVPDLLFEEVCDSRVEDIRHLLDRPHAVDATTALHRVTVFVTYKCNLRCAYCKTIARTPEDLRVRPQRAVTYDLRRFAGMLVSHGDTPIEHLHFTGGEASLLRDLPSMVRLAKDRGVRCVSLTTNGTEPPEVYERLVHAGIDEVRVSLDEAHGGVSDGAVLQPSAWTRVFATVRKLGEMRLAGHDFFLILNTVVERTTRRRVPDLVRQLLALHPDDVKLITSVDEKDDLGAFDEVRGVMAQLAGILAEYPQERFPLLRRKVETVFTSNSIGLDKVTVAATAPWRCYIPLTERTVDGQFYYPCSVYLREGGKPLGSVDEPQGVQRQKTADFVAKDDCLTDPICRQFCLHCTREFNSKANAARTCGG